MGCNEVINKRKLLTPNEQKQIEQNLIATEQIEIKPFEPKKNTEKIIHIIVPCSADINESSKAHTVIKNDNNNYLQNIKSKYILKLIFNNLLYKKMLNLSKYNNKIKNRLNIDNNDYKNFTNIEIEIVPFVNEYCKFINFPKKKKEIIFIYILMIIKKK